MKMRVITSVVGLAVLAVVPEGPAVLVVLVVPVADSLKTLRFPA